MKDYIELLKECDSASTGLLLLLSPVIIPFILLGDLFKLIFKELK